MYVYIEIIILIHTLSIDVYPCSSKLFTKMRRITQFCHPSKTRMILQVGLVGRRQFSRLIGSLTLEEVMLGMVEVCCRKHLAYGDGWWNIEQVMRPRPPQSP